MELKIFYEPMINIIMSYRFPVDSYPKLDTIYCKQLVLTFKDPLEQVQNKLHPFISDLKGKQLLKCYLLPDESSIPKPKYDGVLLGGTFDYIHIGHQLLLLTAILQANKRILVGVTGEKLLTKKKNKQLLQPIHLRKRQIERYIRMIKPQLEIEVVQINDPNGPAIERQDFDAIAISIQTLKGAEKINQIRKQKKMKELHIQQCPLMSETNNLEIKTSSSNTREYILMKNSFTLEAFIKYKSKWHELGEMLAKYLQIPVNEQYQSSWFDTILQKYSEYWRYYHTNSHILYMLQQVQKNEAVNKLSQSQVLVLILGIWFHDIQYVPSSKQNEQVSSELALSYLKGLSQKQNQKIENLSKRSKEAIMATKNHKGANLQQQILIDLDMSILDENHQTYAKYAENIRKEYQPLVKQNYNIKRLEFLKNMNLFEVFYLRKPTNLINNIKWQMQKLATKEEL